MIAAVVGLALGAFAFAAVMAVVAAKPRATWQATSAWQYRNPDAVEPSDVSYGLSSFACGFLALGALAMGLWALTAESPGEREGRLARQVEACDKVRGRFLATIETRRDGTVSNIIALEGLAAELGVTIEDTAPAASEPRYSVTREGGELFRIGFGGMVTPC